MPDEQGCQPGGYSRRGDNPKDKQDSADQCRRPCGQRRSLGRKMDAENQHPDHERYVKGFDQNVIEPRDRALRPLFKPSEYEPENKPTRGQSECENCYRCRQCRPELKEV